MQRFREPKKNRCGGRRDSWIPLAKLFSWNRRNESSFVRTGVKDSRQRLLSNRALSGARQLCLPRGFFSLVPASISCGHHASSAAVGVVGSDRNVLVSIVSRFRCYCFFFIDIRNKRRDQQRCDPIATYSASSCINIERLSIGPINDSSGTDR